MKKTLFVLFLLCAASAFGQSVGASVINNEVTVVHIPSHQAQARQHAMANEENILFNATNPSAHGERPLWEVVKPPAEVPLGDIARMLRGEHATARKAVKVLEK